MGDVVSLVEEVTQQVDLKKAEKLANKVKKGKGFDLADMRDQLTQLQSMGGIGAMLDKMPGMDKLPDAVREKAMNQATGGGDVGKMVAIINSMTPRERRFPDLIKASRRNRANGPQRQDSMYQHAVGTHDEVKQIKECLMTLAEMVSVYPIVNDYYAMINNQMIYCV
jgi:signal recognition particle subunit SRP54